VELVRAHGTRAHILHASSAEEVELIEAAAQAGLPITFETTPHHLLLTSADGWRIGTRGKISPALRDERDRQRLWASVRAGTITSVGSDHAPHTLAEKSRPFVDAPPGLPGVQELLPVLLTGMAAALPDRTLDERMRLVAQLCGSGPARLFGLAHRKGALAPGLDADVAVVDVQARWKLTSDHIQALCGWSAYEGWELTGRNWLTIRRGEVIYREGQFGAASGGWVRG
jgi:dihydroorotase